ncbi:MAG: hypothetical protein JEZ12_16080 [Desulfobacterium sp.]|nr:hypothetical protein [Desulfobacterium sp.]
MPQSNGPYHVNITGGMLPMNVTEETMAFYAAQHSSRLITELKKDRVPCTLGKLPAYLRFDDKNGQSK